jgi:hypothetical protein
VSRYLDKKTTLVILLMSGMTRRDLLDLPEVTIDDIKEAERLLESKGYRREGGTWRPPRDPLVI